MIQLREYQLDTMRGITDAYKEGLRKVIMCAPTGAGKTVMFSYMAQRHLSPAVDKNMTNRVLILTNRMELLTQAGGTLEKFGIRFERITADNKRINRRARCFVGMVETYKRRLVKQPWLLDFSLIIIDECHYGNFKDLFFLWEHRAQTLAAFASILKKYTNGEAQVGNTFDLPSPVQAKPKKKISLNLNGGVYQYEVGNPLPDIGGKLDFSTQYDFDDLIAYCERHGKKRFVVGCTATPISARKEDPLSNYYERLVNRVQIQDLIDEGFLSPCITYGAKIDRSKLKTDRTGEYSEQSQMDTFGSRAVYGRLLDRYQEVCDRYNAGLPMRTVCFNVNVAHSQAVTAMFNEAGIAAKHVDGTTPPAERASILAGYKSGAFPIVCNVGILNAGFDDPATSCIIMNRATTSRSLWLQSCGRGSRIHPGKDRFVILDMGDNWTELGLWHAERDWETIWQETKKKSDKEGVAPVKDCDCCGALVPPAVTVCPECGWVFLKKAKPPAEAEAFVEVTPEIAQPMFTADEQRFLRSIDRPSNWKNVDVPTLEKIRQYKGRKSMWPVHVIRESSNTLEEFQEKLKVLAELRKYKPAWVYRQEFKPVLSYD